MKSLIQNGEIEEVDEDFYSLNKAIESADHLLGQVGYNAQFHKGGKDTQPYAIVKEYADNELKIVYDSRNK